MSGDVSFEQLSLSSNDSWALLDVDDTVAAGGIAVCDVRRSDKDLCYVCNQPLSETRFPYPACDSCFICASCKENFDPQQIPACSHTLPTDASVPVFYFANSTEEELLVMNPTHFSPFGDISSPSCCDQTGYLNTECDGDRVVAPITSNDNTGSEKVETTSPSALGSDYKSLADQVREALNLQSPEMDGEPSSVFQLEPENWLGDARHSVFSGLQPIDPNQLKRILAPKLRPHTDSVGSTSSSGASSVNKGSGHSISPLLKLSATSVLRPSVQLIHGSCNSSECRSSPSSLCSRSPPSLSSSPLNIASRVFKSVAMHSACAMNNFDCVPIDDAFDGKPTVKATSKPAQRSQPSSPPPLAASGMDDFVTRFVWDNERFQSLVKPKPVPKSVIEQSAYNLR